MEGAERSFDEHAQIPSSRWNRPLVTRESTSASIAKCLVASWPSPSLSPSLEAASEFPQRWLSYRVYARQWDGVNLRVVEYKDGGIRPLAVQVAHTQIQRERRELFSVAAAAILFFFSFSSPFFLCFLLPFSFFISFLSLSSRHSAPTKAA